MRNLPIALPAWLASAAIMAGLTGGGLSLAQTPAPADQPAPYTWSLPAWIKPPPDPPGNPVTAVKVELGRRLFYDGRLAGDGLRSCASCHKQELGFADNLSRSWGVTGELTSRNAPGLTNVGFLSMLTWRDPRVATLELQALGPLFGLHPVEMGMAGQRGEIVRRISDDALYRDLFAQAFPGERDPVSIDTMIRAIAAFERTLVSARSPWDRYRYGGEPDAISAPARRGEALFFSARLGCGSCHSGMHFTDAAPDGPAPASALPYHNTGLYNLDGAGAYPPSNTGLMSVTAQPADMGRFRTPSLRNVAVSAPYMHDGSIETLADVIDVYAAGGRTLPPGAQNAGDGRTSPLRDPRLRGFSLTAGEKADLIAFLESLTDLEFLKDPRHANPWDAGGGPPALSAPAGRLD